MKHIYLYFTQIPIYFDCSSWIGLGHEPSGGLQMFLALSNKQCRTCTLAHKWDAGFLRLPARGMSVCGVKPTSTTRLHLPYRMLSEAIKFCETWQIKIPTLCQGLHMSTSPQAKEAGNTSCVESFYCIQYCTQYTFLKLSVFDQLYIQVH